MRQLSFRGMDAAPQPKLRIAYAVPSERFTVFLPPHKSIPDDSCVYRALETGEVETAEESWGVSGLPPCRVEGCQCRPATMRRHRCAPSHFSRSDLPIPDRARRSVQGSPLILSLYCTAIQFLGEVWVKRRG